MLAVVVDDEAVIRLGAARILQDAGMTQVSFASADLALGYLSLGAAEVGLVLTDVSMPGVMDGLGLARWLGSAYPRLPVIVMSASPRALVEAWTIPTVAAVIAKPFHPANLAALAMCATARRPVGEVG
jgi:CheY-like chemotaxis protein